VTRFRANEVRVEQSEPTRIIGIKAKSDELRSHPISFREWSSALRAAVIEGVESRANKFGDGDVIAGGNGAAQVGSPACIRGRDDGDHLDAEAT
jgi:hypothetical protein